MDDAERARRKRINRVLIPITLALCAFVIGLWTLGTDTPIEMPPAPQQSETSNALVSDFSEQTTPANTAQNAPSESEIQEFLKAALPSPQERCAEAFERHPLLSANVTDPPELVTRQNDRVMYKVSGTMEHFDGVHTATVGGCIFADDDSDYPEFLQFAIKDALGPREISLEPAYVPETDHSMFCLWDAELSAMDRRVSHKWIAEMGLLNRRKLPEADHRAELGKIMDAETAELAAEREKIRRYYATSYGVRGSDLDRTASERDWRCT